MLTLTKEFKIDVDDKIKLDELHPVLSNHPAFRTVSRLEKLSEKHQIKIVLNPKYHCELNSIEGFQCCFVQQKSDQTFPTMFRLSPDSGVYFSERNLQYKLFRRFWRTMNAYN